MRLSCVLGTVFWPMAWEVICTTSGPDHKGVPGTVSMFVPRHLDAGMQGSLVWKMAKPGPPGSLSIWGKQNPTPSNLGLLWSERALTRVHIWPQGLSTSVWKCISRLPAPGSRCYFRLTGSVCLLEVLWLKEPFLPQTLPRPCDPSGWSAYCFGHCHLGAEAGWTVLHPRAGA